ncbi:hypothetical protein GRI58_13520 [Porphyrobacter algicida]|uniref:Uncharacterized protein n=1 Tax=Qipengyuania algicida TaxID=1836209 RepID=A0A845ASG8_9SPHN|nr:hypothetical protein [Qipengyuania algicida]MXP29828.1 hypothetical protein [Qipengyuania algicida]
MTTSAIFIILALGLGVQSTDCVPDGYAIVKGNDLKQVITGSIITHKVPDGQISPGELYTKYGEYRFIGGEVWDTSAPYEFKNDRVCLKLKKDLCYSYYVDAHRNYIRRDITNENSEFEEVIISHLEKNGG